MKVKELIKKLSQFDGDLDVYVLDHGEGTNLYVEAIREMDGIEDADEGMYIQKTVVVINVDT